MSRGDAKIITQGQETQDKILSGAKKVYDAVSAVYSPMSSNVAIQRPYGNATITHDGITVAREVILGDEVEDIGAGLLVQASDKSNNVSGDGTSATIMLGYHVMRKARERAAAGFDLIGLRRGIDKASLDIKRALDNLAKGVPDEELSKVAAISASDEEVGKLVAATVLKVGGVGITVEEYDGLGVLQDVVEGVYFEKGWSLPHFVNDRAAEEARHTNPAILVVEKKLVQNQDIVPIIEMVFKETEQKTLIIVGNVDGKALETCALTNLQGGVRICVVRPPVYGSQELPFLEDVATMTGGKLVQSALPADKVTKEYLGHASKITVAKDHTTIFEPAGDPEKVQVRIDNLKKQIKSPETSAFERERMEMRLAKLQGKIGIIKVGGATEAGRQEMKFRVEDAVHATRAAKEEGVVPGGAVTLARLSGMKVPEGMNANEAEGYKLVLEALVEPFKQLMTNSGEDGGYRLQQVLKAEANHGFDVTKMSEEPIDLVEAGVIDPVKVIKSVVENASEVAGIAVTIPTAITIDRERMLEQLQVNKAQMGQ